MPSSLVKAFRVETCDTNGNWDVAFETNRNIARLVKVGFEKSVTGLRLVPTQSWGRGGARAFFGFEPLQTSATLTPNAPTGPAWLDVVARIDPADLAEPENGMEMKKDPVYAA